MRPPLTEHEVTQFRADICRVAQTLFTRQGVEGVTMRQIAAELDCSPTTAYRYFKNKEEILAAVRAAAFNRFCEAIEAATASGRDARGNARSAGQAYLGFALANPDSYRMMFDVNQVAASGYPDLVEALARAHRCMVAYVVPLVEQGILHGDARALGQMLWAGAHGLVMLRLSGVITDDGELRKLHEKTMSALVRGASEAAAAAERTTKSVKAVSARSTPAKRDKKTVA